ncbi:uncharacterized protein CTRU02_205948 [Colletotrichum truncatum]|uniref:Uncharacterized protein n=1 Tax=Colletotrichum truncatum TaxID=5467 RepID=A0ACC3Z5G4_COLTU|nr:uncharacterized protein CTRU02_04779 [Colletotrichum truncatum]KAF6795216.1 hypothetical protein CTRU02_04779 [Colletotrichum truncatum]
MNRAAQRALPYTPRTQSIDGEEDSDVSDNGSFFRDSEDWSDEEPGQETRTHQRPRPHFVDRGFGQSQSQNPVSRNTHPRPHVELDDNRTGRYSRNSGGQAVPFRPRGYSYSHPDRYNPSYRPVSLNPQPQSNQSNPFIPQHPSQHLHSPFAPYPTDINAYPQGGNFMSPTPPAYPPPSNPYPPPNVWNGNPHSHYAKNVPPPPGPPSGYFQPNPFGNSTPVPHPTVYPNEEEEYYEDYVPLQPRSMPSYDPTHNSRPKPQPLQPRIRPSRREQDLQKRLEALEREQERTRQITLREQAQEAAEREAAATKEIDLLRRELERMKFGFDELRQSFLLRDTEIQSEPGWGVGRSEYENRPYTTPARSVQDGPTPWSGREEGYQDSYQQELDKFRNGRRQSELRSSYQGSTPSRQGDTYREKMESDRRSTMSGRTDSENLRRAFNAGLEVALRSLDEAESVVYGPASRLSVPRSATDGYADRDPLSRYPNARPTDAYGREMFEPSSAPNLSQGRPDYNGFDSRAPPGPGRASFRPQTTDADWVGRPPRRRPRAEGNDERESNTASQRNGQPRSSVHIAGNTGVSPTRTDTRGADYMSGGNGGTFQDMGVNARPSRRVSINHAGINRQPGSGHQDDYFDEERNPPNVRSQRSQSHRNRGPGREAPPPPVAPEPPHR